MHLIQQSNVGCTDEVVLIKLVANIRDSQVICCCSDRWLDDVAHSEMELAKTTYGPWTKRWTIDLLLVLAVYNCNGLWWVLLVRARKQFDCLIVSYFFFISLWMIKVYFGACSQILVHSFTNPEVDCPPGISDLGVENLISINPSEDLFFHQPYL
jgi:hypothetical protein